MIQMVKGTYGRMTNGRVEAITKHSGPFSLTAAREAELVAAGVAVKVEMPEHTKDYKHMKMAELRNAVAAMGIDADGNTKNKNKKELIALLEDTENVMQTSGKE